MWKYSLPGLDHAYHSQLQNERNPPGNVSRALAAAPFSLSLSPLRTTPFGLDRRYSASVTTLTAEQELLVSKLKAGVGPPKRRITVLARTATDIFLSSNNLFWKT
jgi:hypothetical protein